MNATKVLLTAEQFDHYPFEEDKRYELDEGELIEATRPRTSTMENLFALFHDTRRAPDLAVILGDRRAELENMKVIHIIPEIAIEVLSPSETRRMIQRKPGQYFRAGVNEVWLIDPDSREAEVWTGPSLPETSLGANDTITSALLPGFALSLPELFA